MPLLMKLYLMIFASLLVMNIIYWIKHPGFKVWVLLYEILSAMYMMVLIIAYWSPDLQELFSIGNIIPFIAILLVDFYFSVWGRPKELGIDQPEVTEGELEMAKAISVVFAAPAYITGILFFYENILK
jgi:hypothetical protein